MLKKSCYDVVIIGGGVIGSSIAYHLASLNSLKIAVVEKDPRYLHASAMLSAGGIRQQFTLPENIKMSIYGSEFIKNPEKLSVNGVIPDFQLHENGYLFLASPSGQKIMEQTNKTQKDCGATWIDLLTPDQLKNKFPWINTSGISLGSYGTQREGYFDPWSLLSAMKNKAIDLGVDYISGEVSDAKLSNTNLSSNNYQIDELTISPINNNNNNNHNNTSSTSIKCGKVVNACGPWASNLVDLFASKTSNPNSIFQLPVKPRKRSIFLFHCHSCETTRHLIPPSSTPLTINPDGVYFRPEGEGCKFICGVSPTEDNDPNCVSYDDLQFTDHRLFDDIIWPSLYERVEAFGEIKIKSSWSGFYEYNIIDQNAIIGQHSNFNNLLLCNGFSGHGLQQSPAAGRAVSELIIHNKFTTLDLSRFSFDRIIQNKPIYEDGIV